MTTTPIRLYFEDGCAVRFMVAGAPHLGFSTPAQPSLDFDVGTVVYADVSDYRGAYEATPSEETQVFTTDRKRMTQDFTVHPIPSNYGRIAWNGTALLVY